MPLHVGVIVEGQGEFLSIERLLHRIWRELLGGDFIKVLSPFRKSQGILLKKHGLKKAVDELKVKLGPQQSGGEQKLVLILIDAETHCPKTLAPKLLKWAQEARSDADIACVMPNPMFETWFAAAAASLAGVNGLPEDLVEPDDPEGNRLGKPWLKRHLLRKYSERVDQPRFTAAINLIRCRQRSASFDKLCRELEKRLPQPPAIVGPCPPDTAVEVVEGYLSCRAARRRLPQEDVASAGRNRRFRFGGNLDATSAFPQGTSVAQEMEEVDELDQ